MCDLHTPSFSYDVIGISEIYKCSDDSRLIPDGYHRLISRFRREGTRGGVCLFIKDTLNYIIREDMSVFIHNVCETLFIEIINNSRNVIVGVLYRPLADIDIFSNKLDEIMDMIQNENKYGLFMGYEYRSFKI